MPRIEVEVRSFLTKQNWIALRRFFDTHGKFLNEGFDETVYFSTPKDLRIRRDDDTAYVILKGGKIHDAHRKEFEIPFSRERFLELEALLRTLGFSVKVRWYRVRRIYRWRGVTAYLWFTKGYGWMIELEKLTSPQHAGRIHRRLSALIRSLGVEATPRHEMDRHFAYYLENWKGLTKGSKRLKLPK